MQFLDAIIVGFAISTIVGPIAVLCINKTISLGFKYGMIVGFGSAVANITYALIAGLGITAISDFLNEKTVYIKLIGGVILIFLGYQEMKKPFCNATKTVASTKPIKLFSHAYLLAIANPITIITFAAIFASIGDLSITIDEVIIMTIGIFIGVMIWWILLCGIIAKIRHKLSDIWKNRIKHISAYILIIFGLLAIYSAL